MIGFDLLRLEDYSAGSFDEVDGQLIVDVSLFDPQIRPCGCPAPDVVKHGQRAVKFKDFPIQRQTTAIRVNLQRYRCRSCSKVLQPDLPGIDPDRDITLRFRNQVRKDAVAFTFRDAARVNGIEESYAARIFDDYAEEALANYTFTLPRVLGMDEKVIGGTPRFIVGDVENRKMLDMQPSRKKISLERYFDQFDIHDRAKVEVITQDMYTGYKELNKRYFRNAMIVIDKFHVVRYADFAVSEVRKKIQNSLENEDRIDMKRKMKLVAARPERLSEEGKWTLGRLLKRHPLLDQAITCKEWFYDIYNCENRNEAEKAYAAWLELLPKELEAPFAQVRSFMQNRRWRPMIFNYFEHPYTNAYIEALNGLVDHITRSGRGYTLKRLRAKALLRYGNLTPLIDEYAFSLRPGDPETDRILSTMVGHGVDLSTFTDDLRGDAFW